MKLLKIIPGLILLSIILMSINVNSAFIIKDPAQQINTFKNNTLLRLHVISNSNTPRDQYIKRNVRDQLITYMARFAGDTDFDISNELEDIDNFIQGILKKEELPYTAQVDLGTYYFPERTYDDLTLPAGRYKALKIILGKGQGANWWCVLLPPMCVENVSSSKSSGNKIEFRSKIFDWIKTKINEKKESSSKKIVSKENKILPMADEKNNNIDRLINLSNRQNNPAIDKLGENKSIQSTIEKNIVNIAYLNDIDWIIQ